MFGFGENFIDGVKTIFNNIESCTSKAGFTSKYFCPSHGVRQGCCAAPYLFLIAVEVLAICIRQSPSLGGISIGNEDMVISQFADDMTVFARDETSVVSLLKVIDSFGAVSGLQINRDKSNLLPLGPLLPSGTPSVGVRVVDRVLGLLFAPNRSIHEHYDWNYKEVLSRMRCTCSSWRNRHLSIKGNIAVVNFLVILLLHFVAANSKLQPRVQEEAPLRKVHLCP